MSHLPNVEKALAKKADQLNRAIMLSEAHLEVLATNAGRFAEDEFLIFHHELQLRKALKDNPEIDVEYAREKINKYADGLISVIMTRDLTTFHVASFQLPTFKDRLVTLHQERERMALCQEQHRNTIRKLISN